MDQILRGLQAKYSKASQHSTRYAGSILEALHAVNEKLQSEAFLSECR